MKKLDILNFNSRDESNKGDKLELFYKGESTGIFLHVLGSNADAVKEYQKEQLKEYVRKQKFAERQGKEVDFQVGLIDKLDARSVENALVRVVGWEGQEGAYDAEKVKQALQNNPQWIDDIIQFSDELGK
jgi:hypothetical protein